MTDPGWTLVFEQSIVRGTSTTSTDFSTGLFNPMPIELGLNVLPVPGPQGPQGPKGVDGTGSSFYDHDQAVASTTWSITHNLGYFPSVSVVDSAGTLWEGDVQYVDSNNVIVTFGAPFAGHAYLS